MKRMLMAIAAMMSWCVLADTWVDMTTRIEWTYWVSPDNEIELQGISHCLEDGTIASDQYASFGDLKIPSTIKGLPVKSISGFMFVGKNIDSVWMPDSIVKIGDGAFKQNGSITNIHLSASLISIGNEAFLDCSQAAGLYLPSTVTELGIRVFEGCQKVTNITMPAGLTEVPEGSFSACYCLTNVVFHDGITTIGDRAFSGCTALKEIDLPSTVTSIGREAFSMCAMKTMVIPDGVKTIGDATFTSCMSLEAISIPDSVTNIGESAFMSCEKLKEVVLSDNVTTIGRLAFSYCKALKRFRIPSKVTTLTDCMLGFCDSLESVEIPPSVTSFSAEYTPICQPFCYCKKLTRIELPSKMSGACGFQGCESLTEVVLPEGVTDFDFTGCIKLQYLTIPTSVTSISDFRLGCTAKMITFNGDAPSTTGSSQFSSSAKCVSVPEGSSGWDDDGDGKWCGITIVYRKPDGGPYKETVDGVEWAYMVENGEAIIGSGAECKSAIDKNLHIDIVIPSTLGGYVVKLIGEYAFYDCWLQSVSVPEGVREIKDTAFKQCCMTSIVLPESLEAIGREAFRGCGFLASISFPSGITRIEEAAFRDCSALTSIAIPAVHYVGPEAFAWCEKLESVNINADITEHSQYWEWPYGVFSGCSALKDVTLGSNMTCIWPMMFQDCTSLSSITLPSNIRSVGEYAFYRSGLQSIQLPNTVTNVDGAAFAECKSLREVTLSTALTELKWHIFQQCWRLESIQIPESVTSIGDAAFEDCSCLSAITFAGSTAPNVARDFSGVREDCTAYVIKNSTGWGVDIPGKWKGINIAYVVKPDGGPYKETVDGIEWTYMVSGGNASVGSKSGASSIPTSTTGAVEIPSALGGCAVTSIGSMAFSYCNGLTNVTIPSSVTSIGKSAFYGCSGLKIVTIPSTVVSIGTAAFSACTGLVEFVVDDSNPSYKSCKGLLLSKNGKTLVAGVNGNVSIPENVTCIGQYAFFRCSELLSVAIPTSVTSISCSAFEYCSGLMSVYFDGNAPTEVDSYALSSCAAGCTAYVKKGSTGWGVDIPGTWNGINIAYYTAYEVEGAGEIKIHDDWVEKYAPGKSEAEVTELLAQPAANGQYKNWECYVLGLDPTNEESKIVVSAPQSQDSGSISVSLNLNVPAGCGYTVSNEVTVVGGSGGHVVTALPNGFTIDLTGDDDPSGLYTIKVKLVPDGSSASTSEIEVEQTVGVRKSTSELTKTAIAVPWGELTGKGEQSICVSNIVKTANLTVGDKLHVYNTASRAYETWQLSSNKTWEPLATYVILEDGSVSTTSAGAPTTTMIARGSAVWLERQDTSKPFYLYGEYQSGTIETSIVGGTTETPVWNFVAPPTLGDFDLNNITGASENDKIVVTTANGPKIYTYKDGAWGSDVNTTEKRTLPGGGTIDVVKKTRDTSNTTIAAGTGFMYVSQGGAPTIQW